MEIETFNKHYFEKLMKKLDSEKKNCYLMGDFNIDLLKSSNAASDFHDNLSSYFFTPFILQPTRLRAKTLIDTTAWAESNQGRGHHRIGEN